MKKLLLVFVFFFTLPSMANDSGFRTVDDILATTIQSYPTPCASNAFESALYVNQDEIDSDILSEAELRSWANGVMFRTDVLAKVLNCPEIKSINDDKQTIAFTPITMEFDNGRTITVNYTTQKKVLKQKYELSKKRSLPNGNPNPELMNPNDPAIYINTDPSWYAIMVVQHGSLSQFVGPDKNNTVSVKYINDHIDSLYPHGYFCTSRTAWANDNDTINHAVHNVVNLEDDSNDYYVAGDMNLEWVMWAEIAADVIITVATLGVGTGAEAGLKSVRWAKIAPKFKTVMKDLRGAKSVQNYIRVSGQIARHSDDIAKIEKNIKNAKKYEKALQDIERARRNGDDIAKYEKRAEQILERAKKLDNDMTPDKLKNVDKFEEQQKTLKDEISKLKDDAEKLTSDTKVKEYKEYSEVFADFMKLRRSARGLKRAKTGNIVSRTYKAIKVMKNGAKTLNKSARVARRGMSGFSSKAKFWLQDQTWRHATMLPKFVSTAGGIYAVVAFLGDLWDKTSSVSQEFTNGIVFKPWLLLSADDLKGQENVVNYGMWFMWTGISEDGADDDAAYLQASDFATKFHYAIQEYQNENGVNCNVDIYVVHPIIRIDESDPNETKGELFYLVMNDEPWTTNHQFDDIDIQQWTQEQKQLEATDPMGKYKKPEQTTETPENFDE